MEKRKAEHPPRDSRDAFEKAVQDQTSETYVLRLFITGTTPKSMRAIANIKDICEEHLKARYKLEIIDLYQYPKLAKGEQIVAVPTLVKQLPKPIRKLVGELSDKEKVLFGLDLKART
ncbi:MAG: circadian clock KaiB family protein [Deltaproteobacteria bacterium]|nr:circadian clock KaiB family protein [Deltaproteobacteria bacterium]MCF8118735.1 circadian clock KaiB family protein [Deltaproteobacteria bacterium]